MTRTVPHRTGTLPPLTLTPEEAAAIALALAAQPDGAYAAHGRAALDKVLQVLEPDPRRRDALVESSRLVRAQARSADGVRAVVEQGLAQRRVLVLRYRDGRGAPTRRHVEPQLLARTADRDYLVAWCRERQAIRWFRCDRIEGAEVTGESAPRRDPATFGAPPTERHPAARALRKPPTPSRRRLVLLPGGRES